MNMRIEMEMNARKEQRTKFKTEKCIRSRKNIEVEQVEDEQMGGNKGIKGKERMERRGFMSLSEID